MKPYEVKQDGRTYVCGQTDNGLFQMYKTSDRLGTLSIPSLVVSEADAAAFEDAKTEYLAGVAA
jgi:hypothetical protein